MVILSNKNSIIPGNRLVVDSKSKYNYSKSFTGLPPGAKCSLIDTSMIVIKDGQQKAVAVRSAVVQPSGVVTFVNLKASIYSLVFQDLNYSKYNQTQVTVGDTTRTLVPPLGGTGEKGDKGDPGEKGDTGETGETGATGATGPAGADGADGSSGARWSASAATETPSGGDAEFLETYNDTSTEYIVRTFMHVSGGTATETNLNFGCRAKYVFTGTGVPTYELAFKVKDALGADLDPVVEATKTVGVDEDVYSWVSLSISTISPGLGTYTAGTVYTIEFTMTGEDDVLDQTVIWTQAQAFWVT